MALWMLSLSESAGSQPGVFCSKSMSTQELAVMMRSFEAWWFETIVPMARVMPASEIAMLIHFWGLGSQFVHIWGLMVWWVGQGLCLVPCYDYVMTGGAQHWGHHGIGSQCFPCCCCCIVDGFKRWFILKLILNGVQALGYGATKLGDG